MRRCAAPKLYEVRARGGVVISCCWVQVRAADVDRPCRPSHTFLLPYVKAVASLAHLQINSSLLSLPVRPGSGDGELHHAGAVAVSEGKVLGSGKHPQFSGLKTCQCFLIFCIRLPEQQRHSRKHCI